MITIPAQATNVKFSFWYHLFTWDSQTYDWLEVYVAPYGGEPVLKFMKGSASPRGDYEVFGWSKVTIDLSAYAGQSIYVYFAVANWYDTQYYTWCYIDDVSVTYEIPTPSGCDWGCVLDCVLSNPELLAYCFYAGYVCAIAPHYANPACWALIACVLLYGIGCAIACCWW